MIYKTINDLSNTIRKNLWKIPHDIDAVCGVPRSGMLPATIIAEYLNTRLCDTYTLLHGYTIPSGSRGKFIPSEEIRNILVVDDTLWSGAAMSKSKALLEPLRGRYNFIFLAVYKEGSAKLGQADLYLEDISKAVRDSAYQIALYEWNIFQHYPDRMIHFAFDLDGVIIKEPCDERNYGQYLKDITEGKPLITPRSEVGLIMTYRLAKHRPQTERWLADNGILYRELKMSEYDSYESRQAGTPAGVWKGEYYGQRSDLLLFVESDSYPAGIIHSISGKPVLDLEENRLLL